MKHEIKYVHETDVHNLNAPRRVVPLLCSMFQPKSVLDVGCGIGTWLSVFKENGVSDIFGVDGDYVNRDLLFSHIKSEQFKSADISLSFDLNKKFDLLICLEVAEHLGEGFATTFIATLCKHSSTIIFGAAIPFQGGQNHLNEQWPEYWIDIFKSFGYNCYDILRSQIWEDKGIEWWYKQNMFVFSNKAITDFKHSDTFLSVIHPEHFNQKVKYIKQLNDKVYELENRIKSWENGGTGIKQTWSSFAKSVSKKINRKK